MNTYFKKNSFILAGVSALVLASCLPQDDAVLSERALENTESQIQQYSKAFHQFTNRSMNALVNSAAWQNSSIIDGRIMFSEGSLNLSDASFGSLNLGPSGAYLASAHCRDAGGLSYHLSWFDQADGSGNVSLKGLGSGNIGQANMRIKNMMPQGNFGVFDGGAVNMSDGSVFSLEGGCTTLNIPTGTAVAAMSLPTPNNMAVVEEVRTILRADACASGESGGVTQSIQAKFLSNGKINPSGTTNEYDSESDLIADNSLSWTTIATDCQDNVAGLNRDSMNDSTSLIGSGVIRSFNVETTDNNIAAALQENLQTANCRRVALLDEETGGLNEESEEIFQTCGDEIDLAMLENSDTTELLSEEEEVIISKCPAISPKTYTIDTDRPLFANMPSSFNGKTVTLNKLDLAGSIKLKKTTKTWGVTTDVGTGTPAKYQFETTHYEGLDIDCVGSTTTSALSCNSMHPEVNAARGRTVDKLPTYQYTRRRYYGPSDTDGNRAYETLTINARSLSGKIESVALINDDDAYFTLNYKISGWNNVETLDYSEPRNTSAVKNTSAPMICEWKQTINASRRCYSGDTLIRDQDGNLGGTVSATYERTVTSNNGEIVYDSWEKTDFKLTCERHVNAGSS